MGRSLEVTALSESLPAIASAPELARAYREIGYDWGEVARLAGYAAATAAHRAAKRVSPYQVRDLIETLRSQGETLEALSRKPEPQVVGTVGTVLCRGCKTQRWNDGTKCPLCGVWENQAVRIWARRTE